jgi:hypothetical protein
MFAKRMRYKSPHWSGFARAVKICAGAFLATSLGGAAREPSLEYAVKATYLYKFESFIEWPPQAMAPPPPPLMLCVIGDDPFGGLLESVMGDQTLDRRPVEIRRLGAMPMDGGCHIAYFTNPGGLAGARGRPILTVTDGAVDPANKGIINFMILDQQVRFEIDEAAAAANGLVISSKLLILAANAKQRI